MTKPMMLLAGRNRPMIDRISVQPSQFNTALGAFITRRLGEIRHFQLYLLPRWLTINRPIIIPITAVASQDTLNKPTRHRLDLLVAT